MVGTMAKIDDSVKKKVPELRFPGFTDDWEERKLKDIAQFNPKTVLPDEFEYVDLESVVGIEMISHRTESKDQAPSRAQRLAQKGDVFYQTVRPYQMNNYLYDLPYDNYVFSTGYAQMRPNIDSYFLLNSVQNKQFVQHVLDRSTGTSYPAINSSDLSNIEIHVPSKLSEQQKIGAFFQSIDDTIALHQRKLDLLKEQKKGYLQKMFPKNGAKVPELRFAGFADDWEERKLSDIVSRLSKSSNNSELPRVEFEDIVSGEGRLNKDVSHKFDDRKGILFSSQNILYGKLRPYLKNWLLADFKGIALGDFWVFKPINSDPKFVYSLIQSNHYQKVANDTSGTKMPRSDWKKVSSTEFQIPSSLEEQKKIGSFFKKLDDTIALHQRKLDLLKEQKKGFLQKMFV
jgi:type I restriction enzyme S subunit